MNLKTLAVFLWVCLIAAAAIAGEEQRTRIAIEVDDDATGHQSFRFDSQDAGFDLHSMAVGESRTLTDESGNVANVLRTDDGFEIDVSGTTIDLKDLHELGSLHEGHEIEVHTDSDHSEVVVVKDIKKVKMIKKGDANGVTVISGREIDAATRERIRAVLESSGEDGEVMFIDGSEFDVDSDARAHSGREVRIIKKEVDVTN